MFQNWMKPINSNFFPSYRITLTNNITSCIWKFLLRCTPSNQTDNQRGLVDDFRIWTARQVSRPIRGRIRVRFVETVSVLNEGRKWLGLKPSGFIRVVGLWTTDEI